MIKLEEIRKDAQIGGLVPNELVRVVNVDEIGPDVRLVTYRNAEGKLDEQTIFRSDEQSLSMCAASRAKGQDTITVTSNEIRHGLNQKDKFVLAVAMVDGETVEALHYIPMPFTLEPVWAEASKTLTYACCCSALWRRTPTTYDPGLHQAAH